MASSTAVEGHLRCMGRLQAIDRCCGMLLLEHHGIPGSVQESYSDHIHNSRS